jgi:hypothetical protein
MGHHQSWSTVDDVIYRGGASVRLRGTQKLARNGGDHSEEKRRRCRQSRQLQALGK